MSEPLRIAVDMSLYTEAIRITTAADGATWNPDEINPSLGTTLVLWIAGLPESADRMSLRAQVDGRAVEISYVEAARGDEPRQVNLVMPAQGGECCTVAIALGNAKTERRIRRVG